MKKKPTLRSLKNKAWRVFSEWVRKRGADEGGTTVCYTCSKLIHWKYEAQAGHAIPGRNNAVLLDPDLVRPQCAVCNIWKRGQYHIFATRLIQENGMEWWEKKLAGARQAVKLTREDLEQFITEYKHRLELLA